MNKRNFVWLGEWTDLTADFTTDQLGTLLRMVQHHVDGQDDKPTKDKEVTMAYRFIVGAVDRSMEKYEEICQKRADAARKKAEKQKQANADKSMQMQANGGINNPNPIPNPIPNPNPNNNPTPLKGGEGDTPAPAREDFLETFGLLHNVNMAPEQYRHLVEDYGQEATDATIDDLSCKLADGTVDSSNHYATLLSWLRYQRRNGGTATMSSTQAVPTYTPPKEPEFTPREQAIIDDFNAWKAKNPDLRGVYDLLSQLATKHGGVPDKVCRALGMKYYAKSWHF